MFWNCRTSWGVICYSRQTLLEWGGGEANQHILSVENCLLLMFGQQLTQLERVCLFKHCSCHPQGQEVSWRLPSYCWWKWVVETSVRFGRFIQSKPEWHTGTQVSSGSTTWGGIDGYEGGRHHRSPAGKPKNKGQGLQQLVRSWGPQTKSRLGIYDWMTRTLSYWEVGHRKLWLGWSPRTKELRRN